MKSEDKIKRKMPQSRMTITEVENWLMERAGEGLVLDEFKNGNFLFSEKEPQYIKYKMIPRKEEIDFSARKELEGKGYSRLADQHNGFFSDFTIYGIDYYILICTDPVNTEEINGDELDEKYLLKLYRKQRNRALLILLFPIFLMWVAFYNFNSSRLFEINEILLEIGYIALSCVILITYIWRSMKSIIKKETILNLAQNEPKMYLVEKRKTKVLQGVLGTLCILILLGSILFFSGVFNAKTLQNLEGREHIISLIEIEGNQDFLDETNGEYVDCFTGVHNSNFLVPVHYDIENDFETLPQLDYNTDIKYIITYDKVRVKGIIDIAYKRWIEDRWNQLYSKNEYIYISSNNFDKIVYYYFDGFDSSEDGNKTLYLCLCNDKEFITITYEGKETAVEIIQTIDKSYIKQ